MFYLKGVTLKINEENKCLVARIIHGGMIHRQGLLTGSINVELRTTSTCFSHFYALFSILYLCMCIFLC